MTDAAIECTGSTARWCPIHGECSCDPRYEGGTADEERTLCDEWCPLHGTTSDHAREVEVQPVEQLDLTGGPKPKKKRNRRPEMKFLRRLLVDLCKLPGVRVMRTFSGKVKTEREDGSEGFILGMAAGTSDIIGIGRGGCFIAIEVKSRRGRPTKAQEAFLRAMLERGGISMIARQEYADLKKSSEHACAMLTALMDSWNAQKVKGSQGAA